MKEKLVKWSLPKKKQWVWKIFRPVFKPFFKVRSVELLGGELPEKCIIVSNHNNKKGPMVFELNLPLKHATWGAYNMLGSYKMRFKYLRDVLYIQKNGVNKFAATIRAAFEACFSLAIYRGMKIIPSYPDVRFRNTMDYSIQCLDAGMAVSMYPEDSSKGYFDEMTKFYSGFVMLADNYYKKTGEDLPVYPAYWGRKKNKIVVGEPAYVHKLLEEGKSRDEVAEHFRLLVNQLYYDHFKEN